MPQDSIGESIYINQAKKNTIARIDLVVLVRGKAMPWERSYQPTWVERIVAALCYFSFGLIGLLYILISGVRSQTPFFRFNFLQAILLGVFGFLINMTFSVLANLLGGMLGLFSFSISNLVLSPLSLIGQSASGLIFIALVYCAIWALLGKQAELPVVSRLVRQQMR